MLFWKYGHGLPEDSLGLVAARNDPPKIAVRRIRDMLRRRVLRPAGRHDVVPRRFAVIQHELADTAVVSQSHAHATAAAFVAGNILDPDTILFHAVGLPNLLRQILR